MITSRKMRYADNDHLEDTTLECLLHLLGPPLTSSQLANRRFGDNRAMIASSPCSQNIQTAQKLSAALFRTRPRATLAKIKVAPWRTNGIATRWTIREQRTGGGTQCTSTSASAKMLLENGAGIPMKRLACRTGAYHAKCGSGLTRATRCAKRRVDKTLP